MNLFQHDVVWIDYIHRVTYDTVKDIPFYVMLHHTQVDTLYQLYSKHFKGTRKYWFVIPRRLWLGGESAMKNDMLMYDMSRLPEDILRHIYQFIPFPKKAPVIKHICGCSSTRCLYGQTLTNYMYLNLTHLIANLRYMRYD